MSGRMAGLSATEVGGKLDRITPETVGVNFFFKLPGRD